MAPSATVPKTMAQHIHRVRREGTVQRRRAGFGSAGAAAPAGSGASAGASSSSSPVRAVTPSAARRTTATAKCAATDPVAAVMPEASRAARSDPALKTACSFAMVLRSCRASRAAPCAFMATFRQPTRTPSAHITSRATG
ncbi:hypothetical protein SVIOM342S_10590 [Streptomyces violaceorubidus]